MTSKPMYCQLTKTGADIFQKVFKEIDMTLQWELNIRSYMDVSENSGTPKSSILIGFSIINHPFWGTPWYLFLETPIYLAILVS